jgi:hypothetical protein
MSRTKGKTGPGRPSTPLARRRDYAAHLLMDDKEEAVFKALVEEQSQKEGRVVSRSEFLMRYFYPLLQAGAKRLKMELDAPKPSDVVPLTWLFERHSKKEG